MVKQWLLSTLQTNNNNYININNGSNKVKMYKLKTMIMSAGSLFSQNVHMPLLTNCSHASSSIETGAFVPGNPHALHFSHFSVLLLHSLLGFR